MQTVNLSKGANVNLSKNNPSLTKLRIGLGWDARLTDGRSHDLDASAILVTDSGQVRNAGDFVFYNNLVSADGSVRHTGDNLTGDGDGDDEVIIIDLGAVSPEVTRIVIVASSFTEAGETPVTFGQVQNAYISAYDDSKFSELDPKASEMAHYDLSEDVSTETALIFGEVYRHGADWKFRAIEQGFNDGLAGVIRTFGLNA